MKPTKELLILKIKNDLWDTTKWCPLTSWPDYVCQPGRVFLHFPALGISEFCCLITFHRRTQAVKQQMSGARYTPLQVPCDV